MISIIIPTYNRASVLSKTLPSYINQKNVDEIIIVDDNSADNTFEVIEDYINHNNKEQISIRYIKHSHHKGAAEARLTGITEAKNGYIMFGEDDVIFDRNYVQALYDDMEETNADIIAGRIIYLNDDESYDDGIRRCNELKVPIINYDILGGNFGVNVPEPIIVPFVHACFLAKKEIYSEIAYDTNFHGNGYREETDPQILALKLGKKIIYTPNAYCYHLPRSTVVTGGQRIGSILIDGYWFLRNNIYFLKKHHAFLARKYNVESYSIMVLRTVISTLKRMLGSLLGGPKTPMNRFGHRLYR